MGDFTQSDSFGTNTLPSRQAQIVRLADDIEILTNELRSQKLSEKEVYNNLRIDDNYNTNVIEGSRITIEETRNILNGIIGYSQSASERDVLDYKKAQDYMLEQYQLKAPLTADMVVRMQELVCETSHPEYAGYIRPRGINVTAGGRDVGYTKGMFVEQEFDELFLWWGNAPKLGISTYLTNVIKFKYRFLRVQPFCDGNGRVSRLIMNYLLLVNNMFPLIVTIQDKSEYMSAVVKTQDNNNDLSYYCLTLFQIYLRELREYVQFVRPVNSRI